MTRIGRRLALVLIICFAATSCQAPEPQKHAEIGMVLHYRGVDDTILGRQFDLMEAMDADWVRIDLDWSAIESERGRYDWAVTDKLVDQAEAHGINVLGVIAFTPDWARSSTESAPENRRHQRPDRLSDYAEFTRMVVQRYAPRGVHSWEVWNEPNTGKFWPPVQDADEYGELFRQAADAIRDVDPDATVLIGGLTTQPDAPDPGLSPTEFLELLYDNGTAQLSDGVAAHPYSYPALPLDPSQQRLGGFSDLPALHDVMNAHGDGGKKIWITEFGAPTGSSDRALSEEDQATTLFQARGQLDQWAWAGPLIYYELVDGGTDLADPEQNFGVLREDLAPKAAAIELLLAASRKDD